MIRYRVGGDFLKDLDRISRLKDQIDDDLVKQFNCIKRKKKEQLCAVVEKHEGIKLNPDFIFDVQVKRLHEYKRQLLNILSIVDIYFQLKENKLPDFPSHRVPVRRQVRSRLRPGQGHHPLYQPGGQDDQQRPGG